MSARKSLIRRGFLAATALCATILSAAPAKADPIVLKVGTLAPTASPWGKVFDTWSRGIKERTKGAVEIQIFPNSQQGDEITMAGKIRNGQLDGAAMTATGLGSFNQNVLALQLPGVFNGDWKKLDNARNAVRPLLDPDFEKRDASGKAKGVYVVGWGDVGVGYLMSKGGQVNKPSDLKSFKPFYIAGDPIGQNFLTTVGVTLKAIPVPEIFTALSGNNVNVITSPALAAEQLQWSSFLDNLNDMPIGMGIGGLVFSAAKLDSLPPEIKAAVLETGKITGEALTEKIRKEDALALGRLKGTMKVYKPSPADQNEWANVFAKTRKAVCGTTIKQAVCDAVIAAAK